MSWKGADALVGGFVVLAEECGRGMLLAQWLEVVVSLCRCSTGPCGTSLRSRLCRCCFSDNGGRMERELFLV